MATVNNPNVRKVKMIGKYELISKLSEGGMGAVYKARHPVLKRTILLKKLILKHGKSIINRFKREARLMMDFNNDHIVDVYDIFKEGSSYYIAEEFVDGLPLDKLIQKERYISDEAALLLFFETCKALKYIHDKNVVHRDIKPANVLVSNKGQVKLIDFGIATSEEDKEDGLTREGMTLGTPAYIAPEQIKDSKSVDKRADIYSMGVMLYKMVTGKTPYPGNFTLETIALIHKGKYKSPKKLNPKISPLTKKIINKCMKVNRKKRFKDIGDILHLLKKYIRRNDPAYIQDAIRRYLNKKDISDIYKKAPSRLKFFFKILVFAGLLAGASFFIYTQGYHYEYILPQYYGALVLSADLDNTYKSADDIFIGAEIFKEKEDEILPLDDIHFYFTQKTGEEDSSVYTMESQKVYLESGSYRIKMSVENKQYWHSFKLLPRVIQREDVVTEEAQRIQLSLNLNQSLPLILSYRIVDQTTQQDISSSTGVSVYLNSRWQQWSSGLASSLKHNQTYQFKFENTNYYPQEVEVEIKSYQTNVELFASLIPLPGTLLLDTDVPGLKLLINDRDIFPAGGKEGGYKAIPPISTEEQTAMVLPPGEYLLTIEKSGGQTASIKVTLLANKTISIETAFDENNQSIQLISK